jgi:hypothetical protein
MSRAEEALQPATSKPIAEAMTRIKEKSQEIRTARFPAHGPARLEQAK